MTDIKEMSIENGLFGSPLELQYGYKVRRTLQLKFGEIMFSMIGRNCVVHSSKVSALRYTKVTLSGYGLVENQIVKSFSNLKKEAIHIK